MRKTKHTPGPWRCGPEAGIYSSEGQKLAEILFCLHPKMPFKVMDEEANANAMLIASAPELVDEVVKLKAEVTRLTTWVDDLQSGMYVNCVYCGHRYGPKETTPVSMADVLKAHIEQCPKHPMSELRADADKWRRFARSPQTALMLGSQKDPNDATVDWVAECNQLLEAGR